MFKLKKTFASALALSMMMGALPFQASAEAIYSTEEGTYTVNSVVAKQYYTPDVNSMCNGVFASDAQVIISGNTATIKLYVANPTPSWGGLADGILKDFVVHYNGAEYPGSTTIIGLDNPSAPVKSFQQASSFFGIAAGDQLACDEIVIPNVPVAALQDNMVHLSAFVNLVMESEQDFYMDFTYVNNESSSIPDPAPESTPGTTPSDPTQQEDGTWLEEKQVAITATVAASEANAPTYAITIPTDVALGEIKTQEDTTINYSIGLDLGDHEEISISVAESGALTSGAETLTYRNTLGSSRFATSGTAMGQITIAQADGAAAAEGSYTGTLKFSFTIT